MMISIVIPTYNECEHIEALIRYIREVDTQGCIGEVIVADGGSTDNTCAIALAKGVSVLAVCKKGRAAQMNCGARHAKGEILYFLHADTFPPASFVQDILRAVEKGYAAGCYRLSFDLNHWFLKASCWFTRFNVNAARFGDQSLFVVKGIYYRAGGFDERLLVMEDQEIIGRIRRQGRFRVLPNAVITSARKYRDNGIYRLQFIYLRIWLLYYLGCSQQFLLRLYRNRIKNPKL